MSSRHREALAHLLFGVQGNGGFVLLTGDIGAGKTTICRRFLSRLPRACHVAYIFNPKLTARELLQTICDEFGIKVAVPASTSDHGTKAYVDALNQYLLTLHAAGHHAILIIDEAQNLSVDVLEQLRLLTNLETNESKLLQIMLIGQPELREVLQRPDMEQLAQRVVARYHLGPLSPDETKAYIRQRLKVAGRTGPLPFNDKAVERIHSLSGGVPRRINLLCDRAMLGAFGRSMDVIDETMIATAAREAFELSTSPRAGALGAMASGPGGRPRGFNWHWIGYAMTALGAAAAAWWAMNQSATVVAKSPPEPTQQLASISPAPVQRAVQPVSAPRVAMAERLDDAVFSDLMQDEEQAWRSLGAYWGKTSLGEGPACESLQAKGVQCFTTGRMSDRGLVTLDRPAILKIAAEASGTGTPRWALLLGITAEKALLAGSSKQWWLPLAELTRHWHGSYATLWVTPPGTTERIARVTDEKGKRWVDQQLRALQLANKLTAEASDLDARVKAFQGEYGIDINGSINTLTLMRLNMVIGVKEPRLLHTESPLAPSSPGSAA
ncbi:AAA family ATPase [Hydrogenophaga sp. 5NK40-0174]|uniref:ExeA family protein n=1 Tax=Hydrogenophaga sp. 5NK40-0174 TaxID=3127649 RepID=UPI0033423050